jgi:hypothetical protein
MASNSKGSDERPPFAAIENPALGDESDNPGRIPVVFPEKELTYGI